MLERESAREREREILRSLCGKIENGEKRQWLLLQSRVVSSAPFFSVAQLGLSARALMMKSAQHGAFPLSHTVLSEYLCKEVTRMTAPSHAT
jgi:hypothetical protein